MRTAVLVGWLLLAVSAHTLTAVVCVMATAPLVYAFCVRAGEVR